MPTGSLEKGLGLSEYKIAFGTLESIGTATDIDTGFEEVQSVNLTGQDVDNPPYEDGISDGTVTVNPGTVTQNVYYLITGE